MKVVVLDDEEKVSKLLCALIDWDRLHLTLAGTAHDGISGLELIQENKPDLLITDIRMPGIDGLEVVAKSREIFPNLQIAIVSGYSQFEYAQMAMRYGVTDYLLKPIKKQELNETLSKMIKKHNARLEFEEKKHRLENIVRIEEMRKKRKALVDCALIGEGGEKIGLPLPARVCVIQFDVQNFPYDFEAANIIADRIESFIETKIRLPCVFAFQKTYCVFAIGSYAEERSYGFDILSYCKEQTALFQNFLFTISFGSTVQSSSDYAESAALAFQGIWRRLCDGTQRVYEEKSLMPKALFDIQPFVMRLLSSLSQGEKQKYEKSFEDFKNELVSAVPEPIQHAPIVVDAGRSLLEEIVVRSYIHDDNAFDSISVMMETSPSMKLFWKNFLEFLDSLYEMAQKTNQEKSIRPIRDAQAFIASNYGDKNLSLVSVAEHVGLSSAYFSDLFKKNCPEGFSGYLQNVRLEKAKELLKSTTKSIKQIAYDVGYSDPKHFSKVFKSVAGIIPNEYRRLYE